MRSALMATYAATVLVFGMAVAAHAGEAKSAEKSGTHTGCLAKGDDAKAFKLTHVDGGEGEYELVGGKGLADHVGHKVEVTGKLSAEKQLHIASMKHVAATCP